MSEYGLGLYRDLPFADYAAIPAINSGVVKWGQVSMRHMHDALGGLLDADDTKDRKFGRAAHCRLLESERFIKEFLVATCCSSQYANGKPCEAPGRFYDGKSWYCGRHKHDDCTEPTDYISIEEGARIEAMAARLHDHPGLAIARRHGWSELTVVGELHGCLFKGRMDRVPQELDIIIDVKKTQVGAATDAACFESIARYGWHRQASIYVDLLKPHHEMQVAPRFAWVFIEDAHPYGVNVIFASDETLDCGRWEVQQVLEDWNRAKQYDRFPDYMPDPRRPYVGGLPDWYIKNWTKRKVAVA